MPPVQWLTALTLNRARAAVRGCPGLHAARSRAFFCIVVISASVPRVDERAMRRLSGAVQPPVVCPRSPCRVCPATEEISDRGLHFVCGHSSGDENQGAHAFRVYL